MQHAASAAPAFTLGTHSDTVAPVATRREELLETYRSQSAHRLVQAGLTLVARQTEQGPARGAVALWEGEPSEDFHGTLGAIWLWSRAQLVSGQTRFGPQIGSAWGFVEKTWPRFIPESLSATASVEAAFDCAMVLRAGLATHSLTRSGDWRRHADQAARLLAAYLGNLVDLKARGFSDPGFLAWNLGESARTVADRGLLAAVSRFVDRAWSTRVVPDFVNEPTNADELFDISCTSATGVLAMIASEGETPFIGTWLRERVAARFPTAFTPRPMDENCWNACVAAAAGKAYLISHDERFFESHRAITNELILRSTQAGGAPGRSRGLPPETLAALYYGLALDSLVVGR